MRRLALVIALAIFASFLWSTAVFANGTGLNTIWIPDTLDEGVFEWDVDLNISNTAYTMYFTEDGRFLQNSFYASLYKDLEIGLAFNLERPAGPFNMYAKYRIFNEMEDNFPVSLAVGVDNVIGTNERFSNEPIPFIVIGRNFNKANGYLGFAHNASGVQDDDSVFGGIDYAWNDMWTFAFDYYGYNSNEEGIISGGVSYPLMKHFGLAGWASYDTGTEDTTIVVEMAFNGRFDDLKADV